MRENFLRNKTHFPFVWLFGVLAITGAILCSAVTIYAQDQKKLDEINKRIEALAKQMQACGANLDCMNNITKQIQSLSKELQKMQSGAAKDHKQQIMDGRLPSKYKLIPVTVRVSQFTEYKRFDKGPGAGLCPVKDRNQIVLSEYYVFEYEVEEEGDLWYTENFDEFRIQAPAESLYGFEKPTIFKIKQSSGYRQSFDYISHDKCTLTRYADYGFKEISSLNKTISLNINYPLPSPQHASNIAYGPIAITVRNQDTRSPGSSESSYDPLSLNPVDQRMGGTNFAMTPEILKAAVKAGRFQKTFQWGYRLDEYGGRHDNRLVLTIEFKEAPEPGVLAVKPGDGLNSAGPDENGTFTPQSKTFTISNIGKSAIQVSLAKTAKWIGLSSTGASLSPGQTQTVQVKIKSTAKNLSNGSYKDTVTFTNLTNGKGTTSRPVNLEVGEMQKWLLFLNGYEKNEYKIPGWKTLSGTPIQYGARFDSSFRVEFTIVKKKGKWNYKKGTIILSNVGYGTLYDPTYWAHKPFKCFHCSDIKNLTGKSISGTISGNQVRLFWPNIRPRVDTVGQFKKPCKPMPGCSKWKSISYYSDEFLDRAGDHFLLLKHNHKKNIPVINPSKLQWINYNYTLRRLYP